MRRAAWEKHLRQLWETAPEAVGQGQYIRVWWRGSSVKFSTYFTKVFLLVRRSDVILKGLVDMRKCKDLLLLFSHSVRVTESDKESVRSDSFQSLDCSTPGFPVHHCLLEFAQTHVHRVSDAIQPSHPLSPSPPALNPSQIRIFSKESALWIRWPKYWSFSFSISPSSEHSELISLSIDWFDLLAVQGTLRSIL